MIPVVDATRAGDVPVDAVIVGVPLISRLLRGLARAGHRRVSVRLADRAQRAAISRALADYPVPGDLAVELSSEIERGDRELLGHAIYRAADLAGAGERDLEPMLVVATRADARRARAVLFASIRKPMAMDGVFATLIQRPLSRVITRLLLRTPITANMATVGALLCGVIGAVIAAGGERADFAIAGALYFASGVLDCVDGELARLRVVSSRLGEWLDSMTDEITTLTLLAGIGVGLSRAGGSGWWMVAGIAGAIVGALSLARLYLELHRLGATIDTAHFPWFFRDTDGESAETTRANSAFGRVVIGAGYLVRRDANVIGISVLLIAGLAEVALIITCAVVAIVAVLTAVHFSVTRSSPKPSR